MSFAKDYVASEASKSRIEDIFNSPIRDSFLCFLSYRVMLDILLRIALGYILSALLVRDGWSLSPCSLLTIAFA